MSAKSDNFEYSVLREVFNAVAIANISATGGSTALWAGLHTGNPGDTGSTVNEGGYTEYTRVSVDRSVAGWTVTSGSSLANKATVGPSAAVNFPAQVSTTTGTFTHGSVWTSSNISSSGMLYYGTLTPNINFGAGVTPQITTGSSITED